jgi:negative regulator of sigma E activity
MTNDERISAYIDNELTGEQEQELLISLAASDTLRKSFRSELVLKKVVRTDERAVNPPRQLRAAVFAAVGIGAAAALGAETANASTVSAQAPSFSTASAPSHGLLKTLFASKINALLTATGLTIAGIAGYGVHTLTTPARVTHEVVIPAATAPALTTAPMTQPIAPTVTETTKPMATVTTHSEAPKHVLHRAIQHASSEKSPATTRSSDTVSPTGVNGAGEISVNPITIKKK